MLICLEVDVLLSKHGKNKSSQFSCLLLRKTIIRPKFYLILAWAILLLFLFFKKKNKHCNIFLKFQVILSCCQIS